MFSLSNVSPEVLPTNTIMALSPSLGLFPKENSSLKPIFRVPVGPAADGAVVGKVVAATVAWGTDVAAAVVGPDAGVAVAPLPQAIAITNVSAAKNSSTPIFRFGD